MDNKPADLNPEDLIKDSTGVVSSAKTMREYLDDHFSGSDVYYLIVIDRHDHHRQCCG